MYLGDFAMLNVLMDKVSRLGTMLSDNNLIQLVNVSNHTARTSTGLMSVPGDSGLSFGSMQNCSDMLNHKDVVCILTIAKPSPRRLLAALKNINATCRSDFHLMSGPW